MTLLLEYLLHVMIERVVKQHSEKNQKAKTVPTTQHTCFHFCTFVFLLLISGVAGTDRDAALLVRNEFMVSVRKDLPTDEERKHILQFEAILFFLFLKKIHKEGTQ